MNDEKINVNVAFDSPNRVATITVDNEEDWRTIVAIMLDLNDLQKTYKDKHIEEPLMFTEIGFGSDKK